MSHLYYFHLCLLVRLLRVSILGWRDIFKYFFWGWFHTIALRLFIMWLYAPPSRRPLRRPQAPPGPGDAVACCHMGSLALAQFNHRLCQIIIHISVIIHLPPHRHIRIDNPATVFFLNCFEMVCTSTSTRSIIIVRSLDTTHCHPLHPHRPSSTTHNNVAHLLSPHWLLSYHHEFYRGTHTPILNWENLNI